MHHSHLHAGRVNLNISWSDSYAYAPPDNLALIAERGKVGGGEEPSDDVDTLGVP